MPLWPAPYTDRGLGRALTNLDLRLRLDVTAEVGWGVTLFTRLQVLDNLRYGSLPDAELSGVAVNQRGPDRPVDVRQLYGSVLLPFGVLSAGRMGALVDWGTGFFLNAGSGLDDDFGDVGDRVAFTTPLAGMLWTAVYELASAGPSTEAVRPDLRPALDLDPSDDTRTVAFSVARWDNAAARQRRLVAERTAINFGLLGAWRWQTWDLAPGRSPTPASAQRRDLGAFVADAWARVDIARFTFEAEVAFLGFSLGNASLDPAISLNSAISGQQVGGVARVEWRASPRWYARLEAGFASGDDRPGFGARVASAAPPRAGDLDGPQFDLSRTPRDADIQNFRFHPNYRIDLLLFRRLVGTVTDAGYLRPMVRWRFGGMFTAEAAVVASTALQPNSTPSGKAPLGVEADLALSYEQEHGFYSRLDYGLLIPLAGFRNEPRGLDPAPAHALHLVLAWRL
jgi:uncharacterized protein (TIGR04551 family)